MRGITLVLYSSLAVILSVMMFDHYGFFSKEFHDGRACAFCQSEVLHAQTFYEGKTCLALVSHKPLSDHHFMVIPSRHVTSFDELTNEEMTEMMQIIQNIHHKLRAHQLVESYLLLQKNGPSVGQSVPHVHFHYVPRKKGEKDQLPFLMRFFFMQFTKPKAREAINKEIDLLKHL